VSFDQYAPYGPVTETTVRIATWNVWGRFGRWAERQAGIEDALAKAAPDVACLVESWSAGDSGGSGGSGDAGQPGQFARRLGLGHSVFAGDWEREGWVSGLGLVSRWPVTAHEHRALPGDGDQDGGGSALFALVDGERGPLQVFVVVLDYRLDASAARQAQVRQLAEFIAERTRRRHPTVVCGDFNAGPDSDELRMLTGRAAAAAPGLVFYDAWEIAGDGTPGHTWSNANPLAAVALYPDRRMDYVLSAWPRRGGIGHPVRCERLGVRPAGELQLSDHYGVLADLRY
jgi:endonuclease/exonuclease/phosphatase family metal-dependent hydrolase